MGKGKWMIIGILAFTQAGAQVVPSNEGRDKTARANFRTVYETNQYYNDVEESIELKYANIKVPIFEKMEAPQDSLWLIDEQVTTLREMIRLEELNFIEWDKNTDRNHPGYAQERSTKQHEAKVEIDRHIKTISELENKKPVYVKDLKAQEVILNVIDKEKEKELEKAKSERQAALAKMYRA
jgi:hypothetical protein